MAITILEVVRFLIQKGPGRTQEQLAEAIFGRGGRQARVSSECLQLVNAEDFDARGTGVRGDPFRYFPGRTARA